jgi:hypothetical protein
MTGEQRAALDEVEHAARSLIHDLLLMVLSVEVILAETQEARRAASFDASDLILITRQSG